MFKITDFGISRVLESNDDADHYSTEEKGSLYSKPSEVLLGTKEITPAVDIYAYGCLMQTLLTYNNEKDHPFGNMKNAEIFENDVKEGKRMNHLKDINECNDLFILADLAIDEATNKNFKERPDICTFIKHPMFWTTRQKELFLKGINNDYIREEGQKCRERKNEEIDKDDKDDKDECLEERKEVEFIKDFNAKFAMRFGKREDGSRHWADSSELKDILEHRNRKKKTPEFDIIYSSLIHFIRNVCEHHGKDKKLFAKNQSVMKMLGGNTTDFVEHVISNYPFLIHDIFTCYREAVLRGECKDDNYHDYFESKSFKVQRASLDTDKDEGVPDAEELDCAIDSDVMHSGMEKMHEDLNSGYNEFFVKSKGCNFLRTSSWSI